jgi:hypothetical protein
MINPCGLQAEMDRLKAIVSACPTEADLTITIASLIKSIREGENQWRISKGIDYLQNFIVRGAYKCRNSMTSSTGPLRP